MELKGTDEKALRRYLLGEASHEEQQARELWLMSDQESDDLVAAAEDELIDDFLAGRLHGNDRERFETLFLAAPERRRKLEFGRSLRRFVDQTSPSFGSDSAPARSSWAALADFVRFHKKPSFAVAALALLIVVVGVASAVRAFYLENQLISLREQLASVERERTESSARDEQFQSQLRALDQLLAGTTLNSLLTIDLQQGLERSPAEKPPEVIPAGIPIVRFRLLLPDNSYERYDVHLLGADDRVLFARRELAAAAVPGGAAVVLTMPRSLFSEENYTFQLVGISSDKTRTNAARFHLRTARR